ncbi:MAG: hypothetical protein K0Q50_2452 [Vampirovibrio sp.]|jgi:hypothetical protein|nr:hypothetical protein [Vampirovibrio sp.]
MMHSTLDTSAITGYRPLISPKGTIKPAFDMLDDKTTKTALVPKHQPDDVVELSRKSPGKEDEAEKNVVIQLPDGKVVHITPQQAQEVVAYVIGVWSLANQDFKQRQAHMQDAHRFQAIEEGEKPQATENGVSKTQPTGEKGKKAGSKKQNAGDEGVVRVNISNCDGKTRKTVEQKGNPHQGITINIVNHNNQHNTQNAGQSGGLMETVANATGLGGKYRLIKTVAGTALVAAVAIPLAIRFRGGINMLSSLGSIKESVSNLVSRDNLLTGMVLTSAASRVRNRFAGSATEAVSHKATPTSGASESFTPLAEDATQTLKNATATVTEKMTPTFDTAALPKEAGMNFGQTVESLGNAYHLASKGFEILPVIQAATNLAGTLMLVLPQMRRAMRMGNQRAGHAEAGAAAVAAKAVENSGRSIQKVSGFSNNKVHGFAP